MYKFKTINELEKLTTRRLLVYYRAERYRCYKSIDRCDCCGCTVW